MRRSTWVAIGLLGLGLAGCASMPGRSPRSVAVAPRTCADFKVSIYFNLYEDTLTHEALSVLDSAGAMSEGCAVIKARVIGLADSVGAADANLDLSKRRAAAVTRALAKVGFDQVEFDVAALGEAGATNAQGEAAPMRRRADIFLQLKPPHDRPESGATQEKTALEDRLEDEEGGGCGGGRLAFTSLKSGGVAASANLKRERLGPVPASLRLFSNCLRAGFQGTPLLERRCSGDGRASRRDERRGRCHDGGKPDRTRPKGRSCAFRAHSAPRQSSSPGRHRGNRRIGRRYPSVRGAERILCSASIVGIRNT